MKTMNILFCEDPFDSKKVDSDYIEEFSAATNQGFTIHLFSFEKLTKERDAMIAIRRIKPGNTVATMMYRGWMLTPAQYTLLYDALLQKNYQLINTPAEYRNCHYLPDSYRFIKEHTPTTVWLPVAGQQANYDKVYELIAPFGDSPLIIKDYVKSQKHYWDTACFIPSAADKHKVRSVIDRFIELQYTDLNEGVVIRQFVELNDLTTHSKSGMPLKQEYRLFFLNGQLLSCYDYWEEGEYVAEQPPLELFKEIAQGVASHFFSMDIAKTKQGEWLIVELGDGQVTGVPEKVEPEEFMGLLWKTSSAG